MQTICDYVDVFYGTDTSVPPQEGTQYSKWNNFKAKAGNTSPGACLPFKPVSCNPYSGGYSSGYGRNRLHCGEPVTTFFEGNKLIGFAHFSHSGAGAFGFYYNYLVTVPFTGDFANTLFALKDFDEEQAEPGYYTCRFKEENIRCEVTVAEKVAIHRYTALDHNPLKIAIDISNDGLWQDERLYNYPQKSSFWIEENGEVGGFVVVQGVKLYFYISCTAKVRNVSLWKDGEKTTERELKVEQTNERFGCIFETDNPKADMYIGFSLESTQRAKVNAKSASDFDVAKSVARQTWEKYLSAIELRDASEEDKKLFYSNYYHSLTKPCGWNKESFLWEERETFYHDFATLWDVYKTQLPLVFSLYPDIGRGIVNTLIRYGKENNHLLNCLMLSNNKNIEAQQACCLGAYVLYDAYIRGLVDNTDDLFYVVRAEVEKYKRDFLDDKLRSVTMNLDVAWISRVYADLANDLGRKEDAEYFSALAEKWSDVFDSDGLLRAESKYYEGNRWNYSFRLTPDASQRIRLGGGKEAVIKQLDAFFAFNEDNTRRDRFEGFNNETDMETPYFYHYVEKKDRLYDLIDECVNVCFQSGRNGCPGNNDSGGLSACYMWNFLGLFPVTGQNIMMLGSPKANETIIHLHNGKNFTIKRHGIGKTVSKIILNGRIVESYFLLVSELLQGGILEFYYN